MIASVTVNWPLEVITEPSGLWISTWPSAGEAGTAPSGTVNVRCFPPEETTAGIPERPAKVAVAPSWKPAPSSATVEPVGPDVVTRSANCGVSDATLQVYGPVPFRTATRPAGASAGSVNVSCVADTTCAVTAVVPGDARGAAEEDVRGRRAEAGAVDRDGRARRRVGRGHVRDGERDVEARRARRAGRVARVRDRQLAGRRPERRPDGDRGVRERGRRRRDTVEPDASRRAGSRSRRR